MIREYGVTIRGLRIYLRLTGPRFVKNKKLPGRFSGA